MNETNFDWDDLRLFLAVARGGGLATAAATTGKSAATLSRRMLAFERKFGRELFRRKARGYELTKDGAQLLESTAAIESSLLSVLESDTSPPVVKISAGTWVTHFLCRRVVELGCQDDVRLRFISAEEKLDIGRREAVIGIRNHRPDGPGLAGRLIGPVRFAVYATSPDVTTWARVIGTTPSAQWVHNISAKDKIVEVTNPSNALDLAAVGATKTVLPTFVGDEFQGLERVSDPIVELDHDQWLVTHHEDRFMPEVRRVIDKTYSVLKKISARI